MSYTYDLLKQTMFDTDNIRNMSVIAHVDHGKSTLSDSLISRAGLLSQKKAGEQCVLDSMDEEKARGITIKSSGISLFYNLNNKNLLVNLIDSPGHVDFSSEVSAALRVTDGALVVVDTIEGVCVQTETVLRQACAERIASCLMINKVDRAISEKQLNGEEIYQTFVSTIDKVNVILSTYLPEFMQEKLLDPVLGNIAFGAGKECWAFRIQDFAKMYAEKMKCDYDKMVQRLWGDHFFDPATKMWSKNQTTQDGKLLQRGFVHFIMDPIIKIYKLVNENQNETVLQMADKLGLDLTKEDRELKGKDLRKAIMRTWLSAADNILNMVFEHLPSPKQAMKYRTELLYEGPNDDEISNSMRNCDMNGPLVMYVSKMIPNKDYSKFYAFGRVFSGTVKSGQKVIILGPNYQKGRKEDMFVKNISTPVLMMGKGTENISEVPCGNICAVMGLDQCIIKTATLTTSEESFPLKSMKFSVSPVVKVAVDVKQQSELQKLILGLEKLQRSDPLVQCYVEETTGQHIIAGSGELHVQVCLNLLKNEFAKCEIVTSEPIVTYKETVEESELGETIFVKSSNKHNKLWGAAQSLNNELVTYLENEFSINESQSLDFQQKLVKDFEWEKDDTKKIWAFAPELSKTNMLVDTCKQVQGLQFIKDSIVQGFEWATREGILTQESMRGYRFNIQDAVIHSDPAHRGTGQIMPMAKRLFYAGELMSKPKIQEPIFMSEIQVPQDIKGNVYNLLNKRRGTVFEEEIVQNTPLCILRAFLPVSESFGFTDKLREVTQGKAFNQCVFHHWDILSGDPLQNGTKSNEVVKQIRKRKGLKDELPDVNDYIDKN